MSEILKMTPKFTANGRIKQSLCSHAEGYDGEHE